MIAVHESGAMGMVMLYRSLRGYIGGSTEPVDFHSERRMEPLDDLLRTLGYVRTTEWQPVPDRPGSTYAKVRARLPRGLLPKTGE